MRESSWHHGWVLLCVDFMAQLNLDFKVTMYDGVQGTEKGVGPAVLDIKLLTTTVTGERSWSATLYLLAYSTHITFYTENQCAEV